jgi:hypothetical protein
MFPRASLKDTINRWHDEFAHEHFIYDLHKNGNTFIALFGVFVFLLLIFLSAFVLAATVPDTVG